MFNGFLDRYPYDVIGCFGKGWDDIQTMTDEFITVAMSKTDATREVIVSNELDFFEDFEATYEVSGLPSHACSFGNEWELYGATMAEVCGRAKRATEKLRGAEAMATLVSLFDLDFMSGRETARDLTWMNLGLFWEHDFGMVNPPTGSAGVAARIAWQHRITDQIEAYVDTLHEDAAAALGEYITAGGSDQRFYAFNPLGWTRTDHADLPWDDPNPVHVVEVAGQVEVPSQIVMIDGQRRLRILAQDVPPVGYKSYEIRPGTGQAWGDAASLIGSAFTEGTIKTSRYYGREDSAGGRTPPRLAVGYENPQSFQSGDQLVLENSHYRVTLDERGAIDSLIDKTRGDREFVQTVNGRTINDMGASTGVVTIENAGPVSVTLKADASSPLQHTSRITLYRDSSRIDIQNHITQNFDSTHTYGFGFSLTSPEVRHEEVGAIMRARLLADGGDYSPRNARYDWLTLNHFADMTGAGSVGVTLSNADCLFFRLGSSTSGSLDTTTPQLSPLIGGRVANGNAGIPDQGGDNEFQQRFALQTHDAYDPVAAMRLALEHQNPLTTGLISGGFAVLPDAEFSALSISNPNVILWALKPAEEGIGAGIIARLWNVSDSPQTAAIQLSPHGIRQAEQTSHIETDESDQPVTAAGISPLFAQQQIRTFRLRVGTEADLDDDGDVDQDDRVLFEACLSGPAAPLFPGCEGRDFDHDGAVDQSDFGILQRCMSGEGNPADPDCAG